LHRAERDRRRRSCRQVLRPALPRPMRRFVDRRKTLRCKASGHPRAGGLAWTRRIMPFEKANGKLPAGAGAVRMERVTRQ
jgi:hypothetical protein